MHELKHVALGAIQAALAVAAGAFGAHVIRPRVEPRLADAFATGAQYHMAHALAIVALSALAATLRLPQLHTPVWLMHAGILCFSGSLYLLALTGYKWLGPITPLGGTLWLVAWSWTAWILWQRANAN